MHSVAGNLSQLNDAALLAAVSNTVQDNRVALCQLLRYLGEVDARKLYAREGFASLFAFCQSLRFSESEAYKRCMVGRVGRQFPGLLQAIGAADLHLTGAAMIAPKMNDGNAVALLNLARHKSKRSIEIALAGMFPSTCFPQRAVVRAVPVAAVASVGREEGKGTQPLRSSVDGGEAKAAQPQARSTLQTELLLQPAQRSTGASPAELVMQAVNKVRETDPVIMAVEAYRLHVNLDAESYALLVEAQDLLSHKLSQGDVGGVIGLALAALVEQLQRRKHGRLGSAASSQSPGQKAANIDGGAERADGKKDRKNTACTGLDAQDVSTVGRLGRQERLPDRRPASATRALTSQEVLPCRGDGHEKLGRSRTLSRAVKRAVYARDAGACTYVAANGRRCGARTLLEYHHVHAFGLGGCNEAYNVTLHCRTHNALAAVDDFGLAHQTRAMARGGCRGLGMSRS